MHKLFHSSMTISPILSRSLVGSDLFPTLKLFKPPYLLLLLLFFRVAPRQNTRDPTH